MKPVTLSFIIALLCRAASAQSIPNAGMETWHNYSAGFPSVSLERPDNWFSADSLVNGLSFAIGGGTVKQCYKSSDAHSGTYAAEVISLHQGNAGVVPGILANGSININFSDTSFTFTGGLPVTQRMGKVSAWLKYHTVDPEDQAQVTALAVIPGAGGADSVIGSGTTNFGPNNAYTLTEVPISYDNSTVVPTKIQIIFSSSPFSTTSGFGGASDSSDLKIDDVTITADMTGVATVVSLQSLAVQLFPNPASGVLHFSTALPGSMTFEAFSVTGQRMGTAGFSGQGSIATAGWAPGLYTYRISHAGGVVQQGNFEAGK